MKKWSTWIFVWLWVSILTSFSYAQENSHIGGYGELHFNKPTSGVDLSKSAGKLDFHRFIIFLGHQFNDWVSFHSELELEHTLVEGEEATGEIALEQAYVQLQYTPHFGIRAGIILVPLGIINPIHEPPTFNGVERPNVDKYIIPSTWRESGIGITGKISPTIHYETYLMAGLDPDGLSGKNGIRGARQEAFRSSTQDFAITGRIDYNVNLFTKLGMGFYYSSLEKKATYAASLNGANISLMEAHVLFNKNNIKARAEVVYSHINQARKLNKFYTDLKGTNPEIGDDQVGAYGELAYDVLGHFLPQTEQRLFLFGRYEFYDTQFKTTGFVKNPNYSRKEFTLGCTYLPTPQVSLKMDYQFLNTDGIQSRQQFNLGIGYNF